jgi:hypothetical protein
MDPKIRIVVYGNHKNGLYPYRVDGHWGPGGAPLIGIAEDPLNEAARVLEALGVAGSTPIGYYKGGRHLLTTTIAKERRLSWREQKALPAPRRRPRKHLLVKGSGIPGDG